MMDGWGMGDWGWTWMVIWIVAPVAVVALVATLSRGSRQQSAPDQGDQALAVLRRRFAAGEIDAEEYERRRAHLERARYTN